MEFGSERGYGMGGGPGAALAHEGEALVSRSQSCSSGPPSASASTSATITGARLLLRRRFLPRRDSPLRQGGAVGRRDVIR